MQFVDISAPKAQQECYSIDAKWRFSKATLEAIVEGAVKEKQETVKIVIFTQKYVKENHQKFKHVIEMQEKKKKKSTSEQKGMFDCIIIYKLFFAIFRIFVYNLQIICQ